MNGEENQNNKSREHLANERTFLAWIRTSIALIGLGFVIVKFTLFLKQVSIVLEDKMALPVKGYSGIIGVIMVAFGVILAMLAFWHFKKTGNQINSSSYNPSNILSVILTATILTGGILLIIYLLSNIA